jgi:hypothetical protein
VEPLVPDQTVNVTFSPTADPQFTFTPDEVTMTAAGKVIFQRRPPTATWLFSGGNVENDTQNEFSVSVQGNGRSLQIDDQFKDERKARYKYTISVQLDGTSYTSPDPHIVNDPGGGGG